MDANEYYTESPTAYNKRKREFTGGVNNNNSGSTASTSSSQPPKKQFLASNASNSTTTTTSTGTGSRGREGEVGIIPLEELLDSLPTEWIKFATDPVILHYQKRNLLRRLEEQRNEITTWQRKYSLCEDKQTQYEDTLSNVNHAWNQLNLDLNLLLARIDSVEHDVSIEGIIQNEPKSFLQVLLENSKSENALFEQSEIARSLQSRIDDTRKMMVKVVAVIEKEKQLNESLTSMVKKDPSIDPTTRSLMEENDSLRKQNNQQRKLLDQLHVQIRELADKLEEHSESNLKLSTKLSDMEEEFAELQEKLDIANRRIIKQDIKYSEEMERLKTASPNTVSSSPPDMQIKKETPVPPIPSPTVTPEPTVQDADEETGELRILANSRLDAINKMQQERVELIKECEKWKRDATFVSELQLQKTSLYQSLYEQYTRTKQDLENSRSHLDRVMYDFKLYKQKQQKDRENVIRDEQVRREALERELRDLEAQITTLRSEKDAMQHKMELREASTPSIKVIQELQLAISARDSEAKRLKEQCERWKDECSKLKAWKEESKKTNEKSNDGFDGKSVAHSTDVKDMQSKLAEYSSIIDDYKAKKKKWEEKERELKLIIETYQTQSKDKRDVREIRISEKRLQETNSLLQEQLNKYEKSGTAQYLKEIEEKHAEELNSVRRELNAKLAKAEKSIKDMKASLDIQKQETDGYLSEIEVIGKAFEEQEEQNVRLLQQLSEREDTLTKLMAEQIKATQVQSLLKDESKVLSDQVERYEEHKKLQDDALHKSEQKLKLVQEQLKKQGDELKSTSSLLENVKRSQRESADATNEIRAKLDRVLEELVALKQELEQKDGALATKDNQIAKLEEELGSLKRKLDRAQARGVTSVSSLTEEELRSYKQKLTCTVCNEKQKSAVIARCYHTFCRPCIQKNLELRSRKCPQCGEKFAESDVHNIYF